MASTYSTWDYYSGEYGGTLPQQIYWRRAVEAKMEIDRQTFGRAATAPVIIADRLALAECRLVDAINSHREIDTSGEAQVTSVNNDGWSESRKLQTRQERQAQYRDIIVELLSFPVNLLFAGACVRNRGCW